MIAQNRVVAHDDDDDDDDLTWKPVCRRQKGLDPGRLQRWISGTSNGCPADARSSSETPAAPVPGDQMRGVSRRERGCRKGGEGIGNTFGC